MEGEEPSTEELRQAAARREEEERIQLEDSGSREEARQHERRADKQAYLKGKLEEREDAERKARGPGD